MIPSLHPQILLVISYLNPCKYIHDLILIKPTQFHPFIKFLYNFWSHIIIHSLFPVPNYLSYKNIKWGGIYVKEGVLLVISHVCLTSVSEIFLLGVFSNQAEEQNIFHWWSFSLKFIYFTKWALIMIKPNLLAYG